MLTFEKVLSVFKDYLAEDTIFEILVTSRGYTMMEWDEKAQDWDSAKICHTPENLKDYLVGAYSSYLAYKVTLGRRSLTDDERQEINAQIDAIDRRIQQP